MNWNCLKWTRNIFTENLSLFIGQVVILHDALCFSCVFSLTSDSVFVLIYYNLIICKAFFDMILWCCIDANRCSFKSALDGKI